LFSKNIKTIGICGATSTPKWLMEETATYIKTHFM
jgi:4-hydroxy-3-methylbut-2-enyl diphosphate reductase IspH